MDLPLARCCLAELTAAQDHQDLESTFAPGGPVAAPVILRPAKKPKPKPEFDAAEIRAWAIDMGHQVSDRGRFRPSWCGHFGSE